MPPKSDGVENLTEGSFEARGGEILEGNPAAFGDAREPDRLRFSIFAFSSKVECREVVETVVKAPGIGEAACEWALDGVGTLPGDPSRSVTVLGSSFTAFSDFMSGC